LSNKGREFLDQLSDYQCFIEDPALWRGTTYGPFITLLASGMCLSYCLF